MARVVKLIPSRTVFLLCDLQTKFRPAIHQFDSLVTTANKLFKVAKARRDFTALTFA